MSTFIEDCLPGKATPDQFNEYLAIWKKRSAGKSAHKTFGVSEREFRSMLHNPKITKQIVARYGRIQAEHRQRHQRQKADMLVELASEVAKQHSEFGERPLTITDLTAIIKQAANNIRSKE